MIKDVLHPASKAKINGYIGERLNTSFKNRILAQDDEILIEPFRSRPESKESKSWKNEFWGKWFTSAILAYRYHPDSELRRILDESIDKLVATQTEDGYIGTYTEKHRLELFDIWGIKYTLLGMLDYYELTKEERILEASCKFADHLIREVKKNKLLLVKRGFFRGMGTTSVLEPVTKLYSITGLKRYLDFAIEIVSQIESADGPRLIAKAGVNVAERFPIPEIWFSWEQGQKAYEMMSNYEGLVELYRQTGNIAYKTATEQAWQNINDTEINIVGSGSSSESWFFGKKFQVYPVHHYQETCVTVTWIKLSQQLFELTGEAKYADAIEKTYYNALLGAMKPNGDDWAKYSPVIGHRLNADEQCGMGLNCCSANGPRGLFKLPHSVVMQDSDGIRINFFLEGSFQLQTPKEQFIEVFQFTDYPVNGNIQIKVSLPEEEQFSLRVRIPAWSNKSTLKVNGLPVHNITPGDYVEINRQWRTDDQISLELDMRGRVEQIGQKPKNLAILRGPIVLARDRRLGGPDVDEPVMPVMNDDGYINLQEAGINEAGVWMRFKSHFKVESHLEVAQLEGGFETILIPLCDYSSAGNTYDHDSRFRVWLRQILSPKKWA